MHEATLPLLNLAILGSFMLFSMAELVQTDVEQTPVRIDEDYRNKG